MCKVYKIYQRGGSEMKDNLGNQWQPVGKDRKSLELIYGMTIDCLLGKVTDTKVAYISNLKLIIDEMEVVE